METIIVAPTGTFTPDYVQGLWNARRIIIIQVDQPERIFLLGPSSAGGSNDMLMSALHAITHSLSGDNIQDEHRMKRVSQDFVTELHRRLLEKEKAQKT